MSKPRRVEPLPGDPLGKRLCQTFPYLWKAIVKSNELDSSWKTLNDYPLRPRELWRLWQDAAQVVGVRFDSLTRYAMIDLDVKGAYHPQQNAQALSVIRAALETIGITRTFLIQSSSSGGLHLWLPFPEQMPTFGLATAIRQCLEAQGLTLEQGQLEIFPNCKAYARGGEFTEYQGHRLPLQPATGAQLLDDDLNPMVGGLERFFEIWDHCTAGQDTDQLRQAIAQAQKNWRKRSARRDSAVVEAWRTALEFEISEGWTDHGQTNHLLKQIACYGVVFQRLKGEHLMEYVQRTATNSAGYAQWCRHQHEIELRCQVWARAAEGYYWPLGTESTRQGNIHKDEGNGASSSGIRINQARAEDAQARIKNAFNQLKEAGQLALYQTKTALENAIIELAKCSKQTTRKYMHLWYPSVSDQTEEVCTNDFEAVSGSSKPSLEDIEKLSEPLSNKQVHTQTYMKGLAPAADSGLDPSPILPSKGGAGGLSTTPAGEVVGDPSSQNVAVKAAVPVLSSNSEKQSRTSSNSTSAPKSKSFQSTTPNSALTSHDDLRYQFGQLVNQMGWSLERVKEFIGQVVGKTLQALVEDDWILLVYQIRNLSPENG
ncbi:hypothetical protein [Leptolyngbya sp. FACHB-16]|uniref:hypothetical protein n=1 Tax=unclassified Leptolyngbya TaxID=2650499 RepID=UPI001682E84E|nr:hypothetical protein [Leptolyngbya sp. FACHB-16]MBD2158889.1 hypothetical protein [Leptolyngbya sp. FACHB-16]